MKEYLVIDGYNVIFNRPEFEGLKKSGLELARLRLIDLLINHSALTSQQTILVFDAHKAKELYEQTEEIQGLQVIYTAAGETADALIEKLTGELLKRGEVYVVTSDWAEQRIVLGLGAYRLTPKELMEGIAKVSKEAEIHLIKERPAQAYLENRLKEKTRIILEKWRRKKS